MHDIEPFFRWRPYYVASEDEFSPFFGRQYSEFEFSDAIYNYVIHPQWDDFGSETLYVKVLYADYALGFAFIELLGEWNDAVKNDIMLLKTEVLDPMMQHGIYKFAFACDNLLNFYVGDDDYYREWYEEIAPSGGWVVFLDTFDHVADEMRELDRYVFFGPRWNGYAWRRMRPDAAFEGLQEMMNRTRKWLTG